MPSLLATDILLLEVGNPLRESRVTVVIEAGVLENPVFFMKQGTEDQKHVEERV